MAKKSKNATTGFTFADAMNVGVEEILNVLGRKKTAADAASSVQQRLTPAIKPKRKGSK